MKIENNYRLIIKEGETWYKSHIYLTLMDIDNCIQVMSISGRLPNCFYEDIKDCHDTNYSSIHQLFMRWLDLEYSDTIGISKPNLSFLKWVYKNLIE